MHQLYALVVRIYNAVKDLPSALSRHDQKADTYAGQINEQLGSLFLELREVRALVEEILTAVTPSEAVGFLFRWELEGQIIEGETLTVRNDQSVTASITIVDKGGNPAVVDGVPVWEVDDPTKVALTPSADGLSCRIDGVGPLGDVNGTVSGDADLGAGIKPIFGKFTISITAGQAVEFKVALSDPVDQSTLQA